MSLRGDIVSGIPQTPIHYRELLDRLSWSKQKVEAAETEQLDAAKRERVRLEYALKALEAVISFLNCDREGVAIKGLAAPLSLARNTLSDTARGAKPPVLQIKPEDPKRTKPTDLVRDKVRGHLAFAFDLLKQAGMSREEARRYLANEAAEHNLRDEDGSRIQGRSIEDWFYDIRKNKATDATLVEFQLLEGLYRPRKKDWSSLRPNERRREARERVRMILLNLANVAPRAAPARRR
jgi:hypothetical protein